MIPALKLNHASRSWRELARFLTVGALLAVAGCGGGGDSPNDICLASCQANTVFHSQYKQCVADNCLIRLPEPPVWDRTTVVWTFDGDTGEVLPPIVVYRMRTPSFEERFVSESGDDLDSAPPPQSVGPVVQLSRH